MTGAAIECRELVKTFGGLRVIEGLNVTLQPGKVTALIGPNGAGKSTLFHLITGFLRPDAGEIRYGGVRIDRLAPYQIARMGVGRLFQDVRIFENLTVLENVLVGCAGQTGENPMGAFLSAHRVRRQEWVNTQKALAWLGEVGLFGRASHLSADLSFGQRKLLALARLMMSEAGAVLLDEPTAGVTGPMIDPLIGHMRSMAAEGKAVIVIEHNMSVVMDSADWVYFMDEGEVVAFGLPDEVLGNPAVRTAYLGM